ncbi:hypothetical protein FRX31_030573 [Thalictrum thalictroides]|uniref:Uncharacterized protein n=1 Tax=Thalictrum thalictroides TaxID=46969 RepID=A0A7J6V541_THATH|nr:hypothetical protein FRX31_030573 [Thalictrum thalictroides]
MGKTSACRPVSCSMSMNEASNITAWEASKFEILTWKWSCGLVFDILPLLLPVGQFKMKSDMKDKFKAPSKPYHT